jgi:hypothetical protein
MSNAHQPPVQSPHHEKYRGNYINSLHYCSPFSNSVLGIEEPSGHYGR